MRRPSDPFARKPIEDMDAYRTALRSRLNPTTSVLSLAYEAAERGGAHCIALNAADEVAVEAFLERAIPFTGIARTIESVLRATPEAHPATIREVLASDQQARQMAREVLARTGREYAVPRS